MNAKYTGHVERFRRLLHTQSVLRNPTIECTMGPPEQSAIYLDGTGKGVPGVLGGKFNVGIIVTSKVKPHAVIEGAGKQIGVMNATIHLHGQQGINVRTGRCTGNTIHAMDRDPDIRFPASPGWFSYMIMSPKGIAFKGPVAIEQQIPFDQWRKPKSSATTQRRPHE